MALKHREKQLILMVSRSLLLLFQRNPNDLLVGFRHTGVEGPQWEWVTPYTEKLTSLESLEQLKLSGHPSFPLCTFCVFSSSVLLFSRETKRAWMRDSVRQPALNHGWDGRSRTKQTFFCGPFLERKQRIRTGKWTESVGEGKKRGKKEKGREEKEKKGREGMN